MSEDKTSEAGSRKFYRDSDRIIGVHKCETYPSTMQISSIGIIGFGDFGQFLFKLAKEKFPSIAVKVSSSKNVPNRKDFFELAEVCKTDVLFICVPIAAFEETVNKILPLLGKNTIICDVATVKIHTVKILRDKKVPNFIATHPMFGPYSYAKKENSLKDLRIALCDSSLTKEEMAQVIDFLQAAELKVLELTADEHDRLIAETLFLTHLVGQTVKKGGFERTSIDTVSYGFLMDAVESVAHDEQLFRDVFKFNPYCKDVLARYEKAEKETVVSLNQSDSIFPPQRSKSNSNSPDTTFQHSQECENVVKRQKEKSPRCEAKACCSGPDQTGSATGQHGTR